jgi:hypothetical protein
LPIILAELRIKFAKGREFSVGSALKFIGIFQALEVFLDSFGTICFSCFIEEFEMGIISFEG